MAQQSMSVSAAGQEVEVRHVVEALLDTRVVRALELAMRDQSIRRRFEQSRGQRPAHAVIAELADEHFLSEERVRTIVYRKSGS